MTLEDRILKIEQQENKLKQQKKKLLSEQKKQIRNARTRRLIEIGAIIEKTLELEFDSQEKKDKLISILTQKRIDEYGTEHTIASYIKEELK